MTQRRPDVAYLAPTSPRTSLVILEFIWVVIGTVFFFFQAEDGIRDVAVLEFRRVLFRSHLKADAREFADPMRVRGLIRRYSDHIGFAVRMRKGEPREAASARAGTRGPEARPGTDMRDRKSVV